jgi:transcriptional regulator with XRE-family HTH domain
VSSETEDAEQRIARRLRELRLARGLTLEKVAAEAELSPGYLSRVEAGHRQPSIGTLLVLARVLEVSVAELTAETDRADPVVRHGDLAPYGADDARMAPLSPPLPGTIIDAVRLTLTGGATPPRPSRHGGEEWLHVLSGRLELTLAGDEMVLEAGDSAQFPGATHHVLRGGPDAEVIIVIANARA